MGGLLPRAGEIGLLNYAMVFVALFGAIATLGLNSIVVRDLINEPENSDAILGTTFVLRCIGGLLAFALSLLVISFARPDDTLAKLIRHVGVRHGVQVYGGREILVRVSGTIQTYCLGGK